MDNLVQLQDIDLAALVSSRVCHDAISPMQSIGFGLDVLDEDDDADARDNAVGLIRSGAGKIMAKVQFARLAFGAAGSSGLEIDMFETEKVAKCYVEIEGKQKLIWNNDIPMMPKNFVKLLLNMIDIAVSTVPRGGTVNVDVTSDKKKPGFIIRTSGPKARIPAGILDLLGGTPGEDLDARSIQPYFTGRIARSSGMQIKIEMNGEDVILKAGG